MSLLSPKRCAPNRACPGTTEPGVPTQAPGKAVTHGVGGDKGKSSGPLQVGEVPCPVIRTLSSSRWPQRTWRDTFLTSLCWVGGQNWNGRR